MAVNIKIPKYQIPTTILTCAQKRTSSQLIVYRTAFSRKKACMLVAHTYGGPTVPLRKINLIRNYDLVILHLTTGMS